MNELIEKSNAAGYKLRKIIFNQFKNNSEEKHIENLLNRELQTLIKALNDNNYNLFLNTIIPLYTRYKINMPNVFFEMLKDDEHFEKILAAFIFGLKGAYREKKGHTLEIDGALCYDIKTICEVYGTRANTVYSWLKNKKLKKANSKNLKKVYIKKDDLDNFFKRDED